MLQLAWECPTTQPELLAGHGPQQVRPAQQASKLGEHVPLSGKSRTQNKMVKKIGHSMSIGSCDAVYKKLWFSPKKFTFLKQAWLVYVLDLLSMIKKHV